MPFKQIGSNRIYYEDTGASGPAVIFSHGFVLDRALFAPQIARLGQRYRCIAWDQRGHGMSTCNSSFSLWDSANDCLALMDALGIDQATLVGLSQGGFISMRAAVTAPNRLRGLVLMDTAARAFSAAELAGYTAMRDAWVGDGPVGETAAMMAGLLFGAEFDNSSWIARWQSRPPAEWSKPWEAILGRDEFFPRLSEIRCPSLVIHGEKDAAFDVSVAREMCSALPDCRGCEIIPGGPHAPTLTHPELVTQALERFLSTLT
jgi:pimeloyl-ACP methyl ester carboxylesterase